MCFDELSGILSDDTILREHREKNNRHLTSSYTALWDEIKHVLGVFCIIHKRELSGIFFSVFMQEPCAFVYFSCPKDTQICWKDFIKTLVSLSMVSILHIYAHIFKRCFCVGCAEQRRYSVEGNGGNVTRPNEVHVLLIPNSIRKMEKCMQFNFHFRFIDSRLL